MTVQGPIPVFFGTPGWPGINSCTEGFEDAILVFGCDGHGASSSVVDIEERTIVHVRGPRQKTGKPASIRDLGFAGMWADRDDITDGLSYVSRLRDSRRG